MNSPFDNQFKVPLDANKLSSLGFGTRSERRLSDLKNYFQNQERAEELIGEHDPVIYEVWELEYDKGGRGISLGTTTIYPGDVDGEFFFTRGHFHAKDDGDEVYIPLSGEGYLAVSTREGVSDLVALEVGLLYYVPGHLAHRTVNTGDSPFSFLCLWAPHIDHDYKTINESGFPELVFRSQEGIRVVKNPNYGK